MVFQMAPKARMLHLRDHQLRARFVWDEFLDRLDMAPTGKVFEIVPESGENLRTLRHSFGARLKQLGRTLQIHYLPAHGMMMVWKDRPV